MPSLTTSIQSIGPVVQLAVQVSNARRSALQAAGLPVPLPVAVTALLDTGASMTCIDPNVIQTLGIPPTGIVSIITASTGNAPFNCQQYDVSVAVLLDNGEVKVIDALPVIEASLRQHGHEVLIGRDVLSQGILIYNGHTGMVTLCF